MNSSGDCIRPQVLVSSGLLAQGFVQAKKNAPEGAFFANSSVARY